MLKKKKERGEGKKRGERGGEKESLWNEIHINYTVETQNVQYTVDLQYTSEWIELRNLTKRWTVKGGEWTRHGFHDCIAFPPLNPKFE